MSAATHDTSNGRDYISLKEYVNDKFNFLEKSIDARFLASSLAVNSALAAADKANTKAELAADKRFDSVNEFRAQQDDLISRFMLKSELEVRFGVVEEKIGRLVSNNDKVKGGREMVAYAVAIIGVAIAAVSILVNYLN